MIVLAGPIASGKTTRFRELQQRRRIDAFNDRSAELHAGSYRNVPDAITDAARGECEILVRQHVDAGKSFMVETTPPPTRPDAADVGLRRAGPRRVDGWVPRRDDVGRAARRHGNIRRAKIREAGGGRVVTEETIRAGYRATMANPLVPLCECRGGR